ncbi:unnamed protein product [Paramecium octaurelia]|uniref:Uncharacterized protein n=1 Tax=Paramecium octaurelia TaxID=43137 RepID=A0A8S1YQK4_PAROT|nr:unnamed protein product [Paramecium octaurelia]
MVVQVRAKKSEKKYHFLEEHYIRQLKYLIEEFPLMFIHPKVGQSYHHYQKLMYFYQGRN